MSKKQYISPSVVRSVRVETGAEILAGSVVEAFNDGDGVTTAGQEVQEKDFASVDFNHQWD